MDRETCCSLEEGYLLPSVSCHENNAFCQKNVGKVKIFEHFRFSVQSVINPHPEYPGAGHADEVRTKTVELIYCYKFYNLNL